MCRFNQFRGKRVFSARAGNDLFVFIEPELQRKFFSQINVGRQLFVCIHISSSICHMNINVLSAPLDRGRQTYRSEIVQAVSGSVTLVVVRPAPFFSYPVNTIRFPLQPEVYHG